MYLLSQDTGDKNTDLLMKYGAYGFRCLCPPYQTMFAFCRHIAINKMVIVDIIYVDYTEFLKFISILSISMQIYVNYTPILP